MGVRRVRKESRDGGNPPGLYTLLAPHTDSVFAFSRPEADVRCLANKGTPTRNARRPAQPAVGYGHDRDDCLGRLFRGLRPCCGLFPFRAGFRRLEMPSPNFGSVLCHDWESGAEQRIILAWYYGLMPAV